jgi:hypothetical protein
MSCAQEHGSFFVHLLKTRFRQSATAQIAINLVVGIVQAHIKQNVLIDKAVVGWCQNLTKNCVRMGIARNEFTTSGKIHQIS